MWIQIQYLHQWKSAINRKIKKKIMKTIIASTLIGLTLCTAVCYANNFKSEVIESHSIDLTLERTGDISDSASIIILEDRDGKPTLLQVQDVENDQTSIVAVNDDPRKAAINAFIGYQKLIGGRLGVDILSTVRIGIVASKEIGCSWSEGSSSYLGLFSNVYLTSLSFSKGSLTFIPYFGARFGNWNRGEYIYQDARTYYIGVSLMEHPFNLGVEMGVSRPIENREVVTNIALTIKLFRKKQFIGLNFWKKS